MWSSAKLTSFSWFLGSLTTVPDTTIVWPTKDWTYCRIAIMLDIAIMPTIAPARPDSIMRETFFAQNEIDSAQTAIIHRAQYAEKSQFKVVVNIAPPESASAKDSEMADACIFVRISLIFKEFRAIKKHEHKT